MLGQPDAERARWLAERMHSGQSYGEHEYMYHVCNVVSIVEQSVPWMDEHSELYECVALLHDIVEDTEMSHDIIRKLFGADVADAVELITVQPTQDRAEHAQEILMKLLCLQTDATSARAALLVKAADRLANVRFSIRTGNSNKFSMYQQEHEEFVTAAYRPGLCDDIWRELNFLVEGV